MNVEFAELSYRFRPWKPGLGRVFKLSYSFDCETTLIEKERHWEMPHYVLGAAFDGTEGYFVRREHLAAFWRVHAHIPIVFHNAAFDLAVIQALVPKDDVYKQVDDGLVWDTYLLHRLYHLATSGHTAGREGEATLEACAHFHLRIELQKDVTDADGNPIRTSYGLWLGKLPSEMPLKYLEYLAKDAIATRKVYKRLRKRIERVLDASRGEWGYVSDDWFQKCQRRWGRSPTTSSCARRSC